MRVYSASLAPIINDEGKEEYVIEAKLEQFKEFVGDLIKMINQEPVKNIITAILKSYPIDEGIARVLQMISDLIVMYFRRVFVTPLLPPPKHDTSKNADFSIYVMVPQDLLYAYVIARDLDLVSEESVREALDKPLIEANFESLNELTESIVRALGKAVFSKLFIPKPPEEVYRDFIDIVMSVPADTRPGLNISKLIPHLLITAAIATAKYLSKYAYHRPQNARPVPQCSLGLEMLRMACLLHDIGKPEAWITGVSHAETSAQVVSRILKILEDAVMSDPKLGGNSSLINKVKDVVEGVITLVRYHHRPEVIEGNIATEGETLSLKEMLALLREGDKASSATDRIIEIVGDVLSKSEVVKSRSISKEELLVALRESGSRARKFWEKFSDDELRTLSHEAAIEIRKLARRYQEFKSIVSGVKVVGIDIRGIQSFIRRESLRALAAASTLIDMLTMYALPRALVEHLGLPLEALVFSGGGTLIAFVPSIEESDVDKVLLRIRNRLGFSIGIMCAIVDLSIPWVITQRSLFSRLNARKITLGKIDYTLKDIVLGYEVLCELCRSRPATQVERTLGHVCDECLKLHKFGRSMYVIYKLRLLKRLGYDVDAYISNAEEVFQHLMEWLSGARDYVRRGRYLAVVKVDGNSIGSYMAYAVTPAEAYLRSIRVDLGTKIGIHSFLKLLNDLNATANSNRFELLDGITYEDAVVRLFTGIMYAGGDDLLALAPSTLAIPLLISISYWFWRLTGGRTVSAGVACGKPKHNIWVLIDAANALLKKSKKLFRVLASSEDNHSALLYVYFELGTQQLLPSVVDSVSMLYTNEEGLFREPYILGNETYAVNSLASLIKTIGIDVGSCRMRDEVNDLLRRLLSDSALPVGELRKVRSALAELLMSMLTHALTCKRVRDLWPIIATKLTLLASEKPSYVQRMHKELANIMLTDFQHTGKRLLPPLRDLLVLVNILMGRG